MPLIGADRSAPQPLPGSNLPQSQHLSDEGGGTYEGEGAGRQEGGQGSEDTDSEGEGGGRQGENYYLLADPRLAEAHDSGAVKPLTGSARSAPKTLPDSNLPHSQNLRGEVEGGRKRAASDNSSSTGNGRSNITSSSTDNGRSSTNVKDTLQKRRRQSRR